MQFESYVNSYSGKPTANTNNTHERISHEFQQFNKNVKQNHTSADTWTQESLMRIQMHYACRFIILR